MASTNGRVPELILGLRTSGPPKIQIASDLHLEFFESLSEAEQDVKIFNIIVPSAPVLALLGDIGIPTHPIYRRFLFHQAKHFEAVLVLAGNHEFYNDVRVAGKATVCSMHDMSEDISSICAEHSNLHYVEKTCVRFGKHAEAPALLCTTLWSHIPENAMVIIGAGINDYKLIFKSRESSDDPTKALIATGQCGCRVTKVTPRHTSQWHADAVGWLRSEIIRIDQAGGECIGILTHHAPSMRGTSAPRHEGQLMSHAFGSSLEDLCIVPSVTLWAYGHTHFNNEQIVHGCRMVCNQLGYEHEEIGYRPDYTIDMQVAGPAADTTFSKIAHRELPSDIVYEDELCICFRDINPQANVHLVLIPICHNGLTGICKAKERHAALLGHMAIQAGKIGAEHCPNGFRLVVNNGAEACQAIYHFHIHILGGRQLHWPPG